MTPYSAKTSSHGCASDTRSRVANVVRVIFAITAASIGTYFARILPLSCVVLLLVRPHGGRLDGVPEARGEVRVDVCPRDPERQQADLRAHRIEGIRDAPRALLERLRTVRLRHESGIERALDERADHQRKWAVLDLDIAPVDAVHLEPLEYAELRDRIRTVDGDRLPTRSRARVIAFPGAATRESSASSDRRSHLRQRP